MNSCCRYNTFYTFYWRLLGCKTDKDHFMPSYLQIRRSLYDKCAQRQKRNKQLQQRNTSINRASQKKKKSIYSNIKMGFITKRPLHNGLQLVSGRHMQTLHQSDTIKGFARLGSRTFHPIIAPGWHTMFLTPLKRSFLTHLSNIFK